MSPVPLTLPVKLAVPLSSSDPSTTNDPPAVNVPSITLPVPTNERLLAEFEALRWPSTSRAPFAISDPLPLIVRLLLMLPASMIVIAEPPAIVVAGKRPPASVTCCGAVPANWTDDPDTCGLKLASEVHDPFTRRFAAADTVVPEKVVLPVLLPSVSSVPLER